MFLKRIPAVIVGAAIIFVATACSRSVNYGLEKCTSDAPVTTQQRKAAAVATINASNGLNIEYRQSATPAIEVSAPSDLMNEIVTDISGDVLSIYSKKNLGACTEKINITVSAPMVKAFNLNSGVQFTVAGEYSSKSNVNIIVSSGAGFNADSAFAANGINASVSSGAQVQFAAISATSVTASASSGAAMNLAGNCQQADLIASSGAGISAGSLKASSGSSSASSGGAVTSSTSNCATSASSGGSVNNK